MSLSNASSIFMSLRSHFIKLTCPSLFATQKDKKRLGEYLDTLDTKTLDPITWVPAGKWNKLHNDGKSTTGGDFRSYSMSGSDGNHQVKVEMNAKTVISAVIPSPYSGADVKVALRAAYGAVRHICVLSRGLSFTKNNEALNLLRNSCSGSVPWCYYLYIVDNCFSI